MGGNSKRDGGNPPLALLRLPDGQDVRVAVHGRFQAMDSTWWYDIELALWAHTINRDGYRTAEPYPVSCRVPADRISPLPGQDYGQVPTERDPVAVRRAHSLASQRRAEQYRQRRRPAAQ